MRIQGHVDRSAYLWQTSCRRNSIAGDVHFPFDGSSTAIKRKKKKKVKIRILRIFLYWMNIEDNRRNIILSFMNFDVIRVIMEKLKKDSSVLRSVKKNIYFQFLSKQHRFNSIKECRKISLLFLASSQLTFSAIRTRDIPPSLFSFFSLRENEINPESFHAWHSIKRRIRLGTDNERVKKSTRFFFLFSFRAERRREERKIPFVTNKVEENKVVSKVGQAVYT